MKDYVLYISIYKYVIIHMNKVRDYMNSFGFGHANGKIILMGEHSVVFGKPAIALPFRKGRITAKIYFQQGPITIESDYYTGFLSEATDQIYGIRQLINICLVYLNRPLSNIHIKIESTLPGQRGLGSSAAVSIAIVRSLFDAFEVELSEERLNHFVDIAEQIHHTNPSGLDATTITTNQAVFFQKGLGKTLIPMKVDAMIVVADTGKLGASKEAISEVKELWEKNPTIINPIIERLGQLTEDVKEYLRDNQVIRLGLAMTEAHRLLTQINVSDEKLELLVNTALEAGALGAKLTGSGKGGCMLALTLNLEEAQKIAEVLKLHGAINTWFYDLKEIINES